MPEVQGVALLGAGIFSKEGSSKIEFLHSWAQSVVPYRITAWS
jgi:hypothetical protein